LRRAAQLSEPLEVVQYADLVLDSASREVRKGGRNVKLTAKEFDLLWFLATHPRRVFSREHLMASVWGYHAAFDTGTVTVHIRRLRAKIEDDAARPRHIETVWGVGYRFSP
jgi:two-component system response regulator ResD